MHDGCRCMACRCANTDYETARQARKRAGMVWQARYVPPHRQYVVLNTETGEIARRTFDRDEARFDRDHRNKECRRAAAVEPLWASGPMIGKLRKRIADLQQKGSGINQLARATGISRTRLTEIVNSKRYSRDRPTRVRVKLATVRKILDTCCGVAPGARVSAVETWRMLNEMLATGIPRRQLALLLLPESRHPSLQIKKDLVLQTTEARIRAVHDRMWREHPEFRKLCKCPWWEL